MVKKLATDKICKRRDTMQQCILHEKIKIDFILISSTKTKNIRIYE